jgi:tetratricopeptide (TPR) repeat protein
MTADEILDRAREGNFGDDRQAVATAVRAFAEAGNARAALELVARAWPIWLASSDMEGGSSVAADALDVSDGSDVVPWRARVLYADGLFAFRASDMERSLLRNEEALRIARQSGDARGECDALTGLARVALREGRYDDVVELAREGRKRAKEAGDPEAEESPLHLEAAGVRLQQDYGAARDLYLESLRRAERSGTGFRAAAELHNLGWVELHLGNIDAAEERFRQRDAIAGANAYSDAWTELNWAAVAAARRNWGEAQERFARGNRDIEKLGVALDPDDKLELAWLTGQLARRA